MAFARSSTEAATQEHIREASFSGCLEDTPGPSLGRRSPRGSRSPSRLSRSGFFTGSSSRRGSQAAPARPPELPPGPLEWHELFNPSGGGAAGPSRGRDDMRSIANAIRRRGGPGRSGGAVQAPQPCSGAAVLCVDGFTLCVGGVSPASDPEEPPPVWAFSASDMAWHMARPEGRPPLGRANFAAAACSGLSPALPVAAAAQQPAPGTPRGRSSAAVERGGPERGLSLFVCGGVTHGDRGQVLGDLWELRVDVQGAGPGQWLAVTPRGLPVLTRRHAHACALVRDTLYVFGGMAIPAGVGPPATPQSAAAAAGPAAPRAPGAAGGGVPPGGAAPVPRRKAGTGEGDCLFSNDLWAIELGTRPEQRQWREVLARQDPRETDLCPRPVPRAFASLEALRGGRLVLFGGQAQDARCLGDLWLWEDEHTLEWREVVVPAGVPAPLPRMGHATCTWDSQMFLFGGVNFDYYSDAWVLDASCISASAVSGAEPESAFGSRTGPCAAPPLSLAGAGVERPRRDPLPAHRRRHLPSPDAPPGDALRRSARVP
eukprot:TRINITY_DN4634_c2_g1_i3.p3 TRINITY_DN4634_c2_g1~~TRINITY_DN4634_c2_g1_i3.p3  ORF type:complete len:544 (+),score=65.39 TRINITY_DN4634_c2_g1_i3:89-1720(+)